MIKRNPLTLKKSKGFRIVMIISPLPFWINYLCFFSRLLYLITLRAIIFNLPLIANPFD